MHIKIETPLKYENLKKTLVLDKKVFKVCEIKFKEVGRIRRKFLFTHFDGKTWRLLCTNSDMSEVKYFHLL